MRSSPGWFARWVPDEDDLCKEDPGIGATVEARARASFSTDGGPGFRIAPTIRPVW